MNEAAREQGVADLGQVAVGELEADGTFSFIRKDRLEPVEDRKRKSTKRTSTGLPRRSGELRRASKGYIPGMRPSCTIRPAASGKDRSSATFPSRTRAM